MLQNTILFVLMINYYVETQKHVRMMISAVKFCTSKANLNITLKMYLVCWSRLVTLQGLLRWQSTSCQLSGAPVRRVFTQSSSPVSAVRLYETKYFVSWTPPSNPGVYLRVTKLWPMDIGVKASGFSGGPFCCSFIVVRTFPIRLLTCTI